MVYSLIIAKILNICNLIKYLLHQVRSNCNLPNFSQFLKDVRESSVYRAFRACTFIVIFTLCFQLVFVKTQRVRILKISPQINYLFQSQQEEAYELTLVKVVHSLTYYKVLKHECIDNTMNYNFRLQANIYVPSRKSTYK